MQPNKLGKSAHQAHATVQLGSRFSMKMYAARLVAMATAASFAVSAPAAAAAQTQSAAYSPWAVLSALASPSSSNALCGTAAASAVASAVAQTGTPGCVFPAVDAPVVAPVSEAAPLATPVSGRGIGILPLLAGLAALGGLAAVLLGNGGSGSDQISVSP
jgi:hypothetical protein